MPDPQDKLQSLLMNRPPAADQTVQLPTTGTDTWLDKVGRMAGTAAGVQEQQPGDLPSAIGGALGAVSLIPPAAATARGLKMLEELKNSGEAPESIIKALSFAQERWPRLFGHIGNIEITSEKPINGSVRMGSSGILSRPRLVYPPGKEPPGFTPGFVNPGIKKETGGLGALFLNGRVLKSDTDAAHTVGHEMLHIADGIMNPDFRGDYQAANQLPGGYYANSNEIRARLQGRKTEEYYKSVPRDTFEVATTPDGHETDATPKLDPRISGLPPDPVPPTPQPDPRDKLYDLIKERVLNKFNKPIPPVGPVALERYPPKRTFTSFPGE